MERTDMFSLESRHTCLQAADAADNHFHLDARAGRLIQSGDDFLVTQGVHLGHNVGRLAVPGMLCVSLRIMRRNRSPEPEGGHRQLIPVPEARNNRTAC